MAAQARLDRWLGAARTPTSAADSHKELRAWPVAEVLADRKKCLSWAMCFHFGFLNLVTIARHGVYGTILTGNTILAASSGSKLDLMSVGFYLLVILFYLSGQALYWVIDIKLDHRTSAGVLAPLVFVLYSLTDVLDYIATDGSFSRTDAAVLKANQWNLLPVAVGAGCISACGAHIDAVITNMITGHYNIIVSAYVTYYASGRRGLPDARKKACLVSIGCVASFSSGASLSAALSIYVGTDWQLYGLGLFAAILLKLHDYVHKDTFDQLKDKRISESVRRSSQGSFSGSARRRSQGDFDDFRLAPPSRFDLPTSSVSAPHLILQYACSARTAPVQDS